jgi:DNA (cytosine-5)-methyltransferase 1
MLTVASTFTGAGGSCLGFRQAGFRTVWANEFVASARDTYRANFPDVPLSEADIRTVSGDLIRRESGVSSVDVLEGSPPCASFSMAGKRDKGWGEVRKYSDTQQRTDDLFFEYARVLSELRPRAFVAENVKGLVLGRAKGAYNEIMQALMAPGYVVRAMVLNAAWYGVAQLRERVFFLGVRLGEREPETPMPFPQYRTLRDVLPEGRLDGECRMLTKRDELLYHRTQPGRNFSAASSELSGKASRFNMRRLAWNRPVPTAVQSMQNLCHPDEPRTLTIAELKRVSGFPEDFVLTGTYDQQWERIGRAVPPPLMAAVAGSVREALTT